MNENGVQLISWERWRQIVDERYDAHHDRGHANSLALAGAAYATPDHERDYNRDGIPESWPWDNEYWKPTPDDRIRELTKAGALIAAAIDSLQDKELP